MNLKRRTLPSLALLFCLGCFHPNTASAASPDHWVGTWATSPMAEDMHEARVVPDTTYREIVHVSMGGPAVRVILTNEFGLSPLTVGAANVALSAGGSDIDTAASAPLTFNGRPFIVIPAGALVVSDPVTLKLPPTSNLTVSIF
ncbi:MAG: SGNH/GDSL hydrolase family protein, partial [Edaphobacter sp.]